LGGGSYTVVVTDEGVTPPTQTDEELEVAALGPLYPGVTQNFSVSHPNLTGADFDYRTTITITTGSYFYEGGMTGSPFTIAIPLDANSLEIQFKLKKGDYLQIPANINCQVAWSIGAQIANYTPTIISEGTSAQGYVARLSADVKIRRTAPHTLLINTTRINE